MEPEYHEYKGRRIELRARAADEPRATAAERERELELLIDEQPVRYGQQVDGRYVLEEYAFDPRDNLMDLARRFIDYQDTAEEIRRAAESGEEY
jgi:hypothetical protein